MTTPIAPGLVLQGPVMIASGTFGEDGFGRGVAQGELDGLGAAVLKTCTLRPRAGNPEPRLFQGPAGAYLINSVGLENPGLEALLERLPEILSALPEGTALMASIAGRTPREFGALAGIADGAPGVRAIELNLSCPNIEHGQDFCRDGAQAARAVAEAAANTGKPVIAKLAPGAEPPRRRWPGAARPRGPPRSPYPTPCRRWPTSREPDGRPWEGWPEACRGPRSGRCPCSWSTGPPGPCGYR